jgi:hypothetical protein
MSKKIGKATKASDKRRHGYGRNVTAVVSSGDGAGKPLANLFHDRRMNNGHGKRAS